MKRTGLAVVLIVIVFLSITTWFVHNQISGLQNQLSELHLQNRAIQDQNGDLQEQVNELQLQNREKQDRLTDFTCELAKTRYLHVEITAFKWIGGFHPVGGLLLGNPVNVTVQNDDVVPLSGLRLRVGLVHKNTGAEIGYTGGMTIDRLNSGERREIRCEPWTSLGTSLDDAVCVVTLSAGNTVLAKGIYGLS